MALLLALASAGSPAADQPCGLSQGDEQRVRDLAQALVSRGHAPGAVVDVRCHGRPWLSAAFGQADLARAAAMRTDHLFRIYSMTKPVTSLLVLMLAEDGKLSIDDPVARHLPEFAQTPVHSGSATFPPETVPALRAVTVRDLLRHTAGITYLSTMPDPVTRMYGQRGIDHGGGHKIVPTDGSAPVASLADLSQRIAALPMVAQPGSRFTYGNATDVLGRLVEVVADQPFREVMAERLLRPLGMHDTGFQAAPEQLGRLTAAYTAPSQAQAQAQAGPAILRSADMQAVAASTFALADDPPTSVFAARRALDFGGAGLLSTAADYQRFLLLLLRGGRVDNQAGSHQLVRRDTVQTMTLNQLDATTLRGSGLDRNGLGFGLGVATFSFPARAPAAVPQDGYFWGGAASTYFWVDPARGITGVLMTQVFGGDVQPYFVALLDTLYRPR